MPPNLNLTNVTVSIVSQIRYSYCRNCSYSSTDKPLRFLQRCLKVSTFLKKHVHTLVLLYTSTMIKTIELFRKPKIYFAQSDHKNRLERRTIVTPFCMRANTFVGNIYKLISTHGNPTVMVHT